MRLQCACDGLRCGPYESALCKDARKVCRDAPLCVISGERLGTSVSCCFILLITTSEGRYTATMRAEE